MDPRSEKFAPLVARGATLVIALVLALVSSAGVAAVAPEPEEAKRSLPLTAARVTDPAFELELKPVGTYIVGQAASAQVVLEAVGPYKVNQKYPTRFTFSAARGFKPRKPVVARDEVSFAKKRAVMTLHFVPQARGPLLLGGEFKFSVCTDDRCLVERRALALALEVE